MTITTSLKEFLSRPVPRKELSDLPNQFDPAWGIPEVRFGDGWIEFSFQRPENNLAVLPEDKLPPFYRFRFDLQGRPIKVFPHPEIPTGTLTAEYDLDGYIRATELITPERRKRLEVVRDPKDKSKPPLEIKEIYFSRRWNPQNNTEFWEENT